MIILGFLKRATVTEVLASHGYRGSGLTWIRVGENAKHVVEFQVRRHSEKGVVSFTINLGVVIEAVWTVYYGRASGLKINEADCFPRFRAGDLMSGEDGRSRDIWWTIEKESDDAKVAAAVKACLTDYCLPMLDRLRSIAAVHEWYQATQVPPKGSFTHAYSQIMWAIVSHLYGDTLRAETTLDAVCANRRLSAEWRVRIAEVRERLSGARFG
ncbi:MAG: DUF4304 domain-containing protein [Planctomycetota bacterium]